LVATRLSQNHHAGHRAACARPIQPDMQTRNETGTGAKIWLSMVVGKLKGRQPGRADGGSMRRRFPQTHATDLCSYRAVHSATKSGRRGSRGGRPAGPRVSRGRLRRRVEHRSGGRAISHGTALKEPPRLAGAHAIPNIRERGASMTIRTGVRDARRNGGPETCWRSSAPNVIQIAPWQVAAGWWAGASKSSAARRAAFLRAFKRDGQHYRAEATRYSTSQNRQSRMGRA